MNIKKLIPIFGLSTILTIPFGNKVVPLEAASDISIKEDWQRSRIRLHHDDDMGIDYLGTWFYWDTAELQPLDNKDAYYFRILLEADNEGDYNFSFKYVGANYIVRYYLNNNPYEDETLAGGWQQYNIKNKTLHLLKGLNVFIIQVLNYGGIVSYSISDGARVVKNSGEGTYYFEEQDNIGPHLYGDVKDPNADLFIGPLATDENPDYTDRSTVKFVTLADTHSLDLSYKLVANATSNNPQLNLSINGGIDETISLTEKSLNELHTINIPEDTLEAMGFDFTLGAVNELKFSSAEESKDCILLDTLRSSSEETEDPFLTKDLSVNDIKANSQIMGRRIDVAGEIPLDWSASNVSFIYHGKHSLKATFKAINKATFLVEVDGKTRYINVSANSTTKTTISAPLDEGDHLVRIFKSSEANGGIASLVGLTIDENGSISAPEAKDYKFEFYGSSTTCANQVYRDGMEDGYLGFARIISDAYNAEFNTMCVSGRGLQAGYNSEDGWQASHDKQLNYLYKYTSYFRDNTKMWNFSSYIPDVLVLNVGNNDLGKAIMEELDFTIDDFTNEVKRFHNEIRTIYPASTKIIYLYGMYSNRGYESEYRAAIDELKQIDHNVEFVYTPKMGSGATEHPSREEHEYVASYLSEAVAKMLGIDNPLGESIRIEAEDCKITGRYVVRTPISDWEAWSGGKYVGNIGPEEPINNASEIKLDGSNVKIFEIPVNVSKGGRYEVRVNYASEMSSSSRIYYKVNDESDYRTLAFKSTDGWATPCNYSEAMYVSLKQGANKIYVTGPSTRDSWANYDYFQLLGIEDDNSIYTNVEGSDLYNILELESYYPKGSDIRFKVELTERASQFTGEYQVYVNGVALNQSPDGYYSISNVQEDINIEVKGITPNSWNVYYYDGDVLVRTVKYQIGEYIQDFRLPDKYHLRFNGWDIVVPVYMPNNDVILHAVFVEDPNAGVSKTNVGLIVGLSVGITLGVAGIAVGTIFIVKGIKKRKAVSENEK